jgi:hypothetical protein
MASSWQKFEELIKQEMRKIYSEAVVEHSMDPRNLGELEEANGFARVTERVSEKYRISRYL